MGLFSSKKRSSSSPAPIPATVPSSKVVRPQRSTTTPTGKSRQHTSTVTITGPGTDNGNGGKRSNTSSNAARLSSVPKVIEEQEPEEDKTGATTTKTTAKTRSSKKPDKTAFTLAELQSKLASNKTDIKGYRSNLSASSPGKVNGSHIKKDNANGHNNNLSVSFASDTKDASSMISEHSVGTDQFDKTIGNTGTKSVPKIVATSSPVNSDNTHPLVPAVVSGNNDGINNTEKQMTKINKIITTEDEDEDEADKITDLDKGRFRSKTVSDSDHKHYGRSGVVHSNSVTSLPGSVQVITEPLTNAVKAAKPITNSLAKRYDKTIGKNLQQTSSKMLEPPQAAISGAVKMVKPVLPAILTSKSETNLASLSAATPIPFSFGSGGNNNNNNKNTTTNNNNNLRVSNTSIGIINNNNNNNNDTAASTPAQDRVKLSGITYASARRDYTFHNFFKDIPESERLIDDFSCALHGDMPIKGRMYVTDRNIFFYSNILTYITDVKIPFREIVQIQKKSIVGIIPNSLVIDTLGSRYIFASVLSRDSIYNLLFTIWEQYGVVVQSRDDVTRVIDSNSSKNNGSSNSQSNNDNDDDGEDDDDDDDDDYLISDLDTDDSEDDEYVDRNEARSVATSEHSDLKKRRKRASSRATTTTSISRDSIGSSMHNISNNSNGIPGPIKHSPTTPSFQPRDFEKLINESIFYAPMGQVVNYLFGPDTEYLKKILIKQKNFDLSEIPGTLLQNKSREYTYMKPISGSIGPSKTKCIITETVDTYDLENTVQITQITKNPDVPSGNVFQTRTTFVFHWDVKNTTKMLVYVGVEWSGKSWIKSAVNKGTIDGVTDATKILASELQSFIQTDMSSFPSKKKQRRKRQQQQQQESEEDETDNGTGYDLPSREPFSHSPTEANIVLGKSDTIIKQNVLFPCPLGTAYQILFGDNTSYLKGIVAKQNNFDISDIPGFKAKKRDYAYTKKLNNSIGPKQTKCFITETLENDDMNSYIHVKQISKTPDVPSGNSFYVQTSFYLAWGGNNTTKMSVVTSVVWTGKSFLKSAIEKGSIEGQTGTTEILIREVNRILGNAKLSKKKGKGKKGKKNGRSADTLRFRDNDEQLDGGHVTVTTSGNVAELATTDTGSRWLPFSFEMIQSKFFDTLVTPLIELDFFSVRFFIAILLWLTIIFMFVKCIVLLPIWYTSTSTKYHGTITVLAPGKMIIDGYEYNYAPSFKTLYNLYEDEVLNGNSDILFESEKAIWDWIEDRAGLATCLGSDSDSGSDYNSGSSSIDSYNDQTHNLDDYFAAQYANVVSPSKRHSRGSRDHGKVTAKGFTKGSSSRAGDGNGNSNTDSDRDNPIEQLREVLRLANLQLADMQKRIDELQERASAANSS